MCFYGVLSFFCLKFPFQIFWLGKIMEFNFFKGLRLVALILQSVFFLFALRIYSISLFCLCVWCKKVCYFRLFPIVAVFLISFFFTVPCLMCRSVFLRQKRNRRSSLLILLIAKVSFFSSWFRRRFHCDDAMNTHRNNVYN